MIDAKNSRTTDNFHHCRNTSSSPKTRCSSNTTAAKKNKVLRSSLGRTGFSVISKNLTKAYHSPPSNVNYLCRKSTNASHSLISVLENYRCQFKKITVTVPQTGRFGFAVYSPRGMPYGIHTVDSCDLHS